MESIVKEKPHLSCGTNALAIRNRIRILRLLIPFGLKEMRQMPNHPRLIPPVVLVFFFGMTTQAQIPQGYFTDVINVGPIANTNAHDYDPAVSADGLTLYVNRISTETLPGHQGSSAIADIWMATPSGLR
jgi:hypothetical protein